MLERIEDDRPVLLVDGIVGSLQVPILDQGLGERVALAYGRFGRDVVLGCRHLVIERPLLLEFCFFPFSS